MIQYFQELGAIKIAPQPSKTYKLLSQQKQTWPLTTDTMMFGVWENINNKNSNNVQ